MYNQIFAAISKHIALSKSEELLITNRLKEIKLSKKEYVLNQGQSCKSIYYVNLGVLRAYHLNNDGKDSTVMFAVSDWWVTDMSAFTYSHPALLSIQAVANCQLLQLSKESLEQLYQEVPAFEKYFRVIMQNAYIREQSRTIQNLSLTAKTRYENFIAKYPQVVANVPQKQIASYLGITPEFLSTIRSAT